MLKIVCIVLAVSLYLTPMYACAKDSEVTSSSYWTDLIHQENSIVASVLYVPVMVLQVPVRIIDGIINPKPTSYATIPPAAHKSHK